MGSPDGRPGRLDGKVVLITGTAVAMGRVAACLTSDDASYINGAAIPVDGAHSIIE